MNSETLTEEVNQPRLGGKYRFTQEAYEFLQRKQSSVLSRKTMSWVIGQHLLGVLCPIINMAVVEQLENADSPTFNERLKRLFHLVRLRDFQPSDYFRISGIVDDAYRLQIQTLCEWLDLEDGHISGFFQLTEQLGLTRHANNYVHLTAKGFERVDELRSSNKESKQGFIAMWFEPSLRVACDRGIEPAIRAAGYDPMRIDKKEHNNKIDDEIIAEIKRSRFVVADFTCEKISLNDRIFGVPRGGVYFEAGYAMGLNIPVIWTCRRDLIGEVHFDTRQFAHVVWDTPNDLKVSLYNRIRATVGELPNAPGLVSEHAK